MIVASFYAPREDRYPGVDYDTLLPLLDASCRRVGVEHWVISDQKRPGLKTFQCKLPENLMLATLDGQRQFLECAHEPVMFTGADCILTRDPRRILAGDMTVTLGPFSDCEMNTGAVWVDDGQKCAAIWADAIARGPSAWGDDQTMLYAAIQASGIDWRAVRCEDHNWAPDHADDDAGMPTVVHFRGKRKTFMAAWAARFIPDLMRVTADG